MNNNDITPGFDDEKDDTLRIGLQKIEEGSGLILLRRLRKNWTMGTSHGGRKLLRELMSF